MPIVPVARALYLCDYHVGYSDTKVDLYGIFNALRPESGTRTSKVGVVFSPN